MERRLRLVEWRAAKALVGAVPLLMAAATTLSGCGSGAPPDNHYQGSYRSQYVIPSVSSESGIFSFAIAQKGDMTGSFVTQSNKTEPFSGTIGNNGQFSGTVTDGASHYSVSGTLSLSGGTGTVPGGNFNEMRNGVPAAGSFSLTTTEVTLPTPTPVPTATPTPVPFVSTFNEAYRGTYSIPEQSENGNLSFTVDVSGNITGFFSQSENQPVATFTGTIANDGTFKGSLTYDPSSHLAARTIVGTMSKSSVSAGTSGDFVVTIGGVLMPGNFEATVGASEPDSNYRASYAVDGSLGNAFDASQLPPSGPFFSSGNINFNVDKEGSLVGTVGSYPIDARITNDGRIVGSLTANGTLYAFRGIVNKTTIKTATNSAPGIQANLIVTINTKEYPLSILAYGGDGITK